MDQKYTITEKQLQILSKFYDLRGKVYATFYALDKSTQRRISYEAEEIAAFSAVANDITSMKELSKDWNTDLIDKLLSTEDKVYYSNYLEILNNFSKTFSKDINDINTAKLLEINSKLLSQDSSTFRNSIKEISSTTVEDGIKYEYRSEVRTHPNAISPKLKSFFHWLHTNPEIHPVIKAAVCYFKIAEIHPFSEANGRTSKIVARSILYKYGLDPELLLTKDDYFLLNQNYYFEMIEQTIKSGDMTKWIEFYSKALLHGVTQSARLIRYHTAGTIDIINDKIIKITKREMAVMKIINRTQNSSGAEIGRELKMTRQNVNNILKQLIKRGIIRKIGKSTGVRYIPVNS